MQTVESSYTLRKKSVHVACFAGPRKTFLLRDVNPVYGFNDSCVILLNQQSILTQLPTAPIVAREV